MIEKSFVGGLSCSVGDERLRELLATAGVIEAAAVTLKLEFANSAGSVGAGRGGGSGSTGAVRG